MYGAYNRSCHIETLRQVSVILGCENKYLFFQQSIPIYACEELMALDIFNAISSSTQPVKKLYMHRKKTNHTWISFIIYQ